MFRPRSSLPHRNLLQEFHLTRLDKFSGLQPVELSAAWQRAGREGNFMNPSIFFTFDKLLNFLSEDIVDLERHKTPSWERVLDCRRWIERIWIVLAKLELIRDLVCVTLD